MSAYLENSHLLLSTQDGILRTEKVNEADRYDFVPGKAMGTIADNKNRKEEGYA